MSEDFLDFKIEIASDDDGFVVEVDFIGLDEGIQRRFQAKLPPPHDDLLPKSEEAEALKHELGEFRKAPFGAAPDEFPFLIGTMAKLEQYGSRLFSAILPPQFEQALGQLLAQEAGNSGVRIRLDLERAPSLATIPFEAMFRQTTDYWFATNEQSPIFRQLRAGGLTAPKPIAGMAKLLIAIAVPQSDLDAGREIRLIEDQILERTDALPGSFEIRTLAGVTRDKFDEAMSKFKPDIVHFIGHGGVEEGDGEGSGLGVVYFVSEDDETGYDPVTSDDFRDLLVNEKPALVVLNTCEGGRANSLDPYGGTAQNIVRRAAPYVVAMQYPISDRAAIVFARRFYARLLEGAPVDVAVARGRSSIRNQQDERCKVELITPVLYSSVVSPGPLILPPVQPSAGGAAIDAPRLPPPAAEGAVSALPPAGRARRKFPWIIAGGAALLFLFVVAYAFLTTSRRTRGPMTTASASSIKYSMEPKSGDAAPLAPTPMPTPTPAPPSANSHEGLTEAGMIDKTQPHGFTKPASSPEPEPMPKPGSSSEPSRTPAPEPTPPPAPKTTPGPSRDLTPTWDPQPEPVPPNPITAVPVIAFFDFGSQAISPEAAAILDNAIEMYRATGVRMEISGHADRVGSASVNLAVSMRRADAVAEYLRARGVPGSAMIIEAFGESRPRVDTADGVREILNRRVEITPISGPN